MIRQSLNAEEVLSKQKESLVTAIHYAKKEEMRRMSRLQQSSSKKIKDNLETRFESDRMTDQTKISNLILDFNLLKTKIENGSFAKEVPIRKISLHRAHPESNRFAGNMGEKDTVSTQTVTFVFVSFITYHENLPTALSTLLTCILHNHYRSRATDIF